MTVLAHQHVSDTQALERVHVQIAFATLANVGDRVTQGRVAGWVTRQGFLKVRDQLLELAAAFPGGRYRPSPALEKIS